MRRLLFTLTFLASSTLLLSQTERDIDFSKLKYIKSENVHSDVSLPYIQHSGEEIPTASDHFLISGGRTGAASGEVIGTTTYDLQSNSGHPNRIVVHSGGEVSATWTGSVETAPGWPDRGSFYNYYDGSAWGTAPDSRIEPVRTGWPSIITRSGKDIVYSHDPAAFGYILQTESNTGSGSWTNTIPTGGVLEGIWCRAGVDESNGTIHLLTCNYDNAAGNNFTLYYRSLDGGVTWDIQRYRLPGIDTASGYNAMGAEPFNVVARDGKVAVVAANSNNDLAVWISNSNGDLGSWTRTRLLDFPIDNFDGNEITDLDGDLMADEVETTDGSHTIVIDNSGKVHVMSGAMIILDDVPGDAAWSFFPGVSGIFYWNEDFGADSLQLLDVLLDWDLSGDPFDGIGADLPNYGVGLTSQMNAVVDRNTGTIYVVVPIPVEGSDFFGDPTNPAAQSFRDLFGFYSNDGGATWTIAVNLTRVASDFFENVFPSAYQEVVNDQIHVVWQRDEEPGHSLEATPDPVAVNEIVYEAFDFSAFEPYAPTAGFTVDYPGSGSSAQFINTSVDAIEYIWDFDDGTASNIRNPSHIFPEDGTYNVCLTATNVYGDDTFCEDVTIVGAGTAIEDIAIERDIALYPNPSSGFVVLEVSTDLFKEASISVFDITGKQVLPELNRRIHLGDKINLDLSTLSSGNYLVRIQTEEAVSVRKVILDN